MRVASLVFFYLTGRQAPRPRVPPTDIKRHANRAVFHDFLGGENFGVVVSLLIAAKKAQWQFHCARPYSTGLVTKRPEMSPRLTARGTQGTPARPSNTGARSMIASANASSIADTARLSTRVKALAQVKSPRAPLDARSSDFSISCAYEGHFKLRCVTFHRATSELHRTSLRAIADTAKSVLLPALLRAFKPLGTASGRLPPVFCRILPSQRSSLRRRPRAAPANAKLLATARNAGASGNSLGARRRRLCGSPALRLAGSPARRLYGSTARRLAGSAASNCNGFASHIQVLRQQRQTVAKPRPYAHDSTASRRLSKVNTCFIQAEIPSEPCFFKV